MAYRTIALSELLVNRSNDRHGELENETAAIGWLFSNHLGQMRKLAEDIVKSKGLFEPPLVYQEGRQFIVFDGNRRTTCLKVLADPKRAPNAELREYFEKLRSQWVGHFPDRILCRVEPDRDVIDEILYRRHTGSQSGVGQSTWTGRMKTTFVNRTGKGGKFNIADEIETRLRAADLLPKSGQIPRSNLSRLLSAEAFRNRVGISMARGRFEFIRNEEASLKALSRIAEDLVSKRKTLDDVWDVDRKLAYLDALEREGVLPTAADALPSPGSRGTKPAKPVTGASPSAATNSGVATVVSITTAPRPTKRTALILQHDSGVAWTGRLQRQRAIWEELQFKLDLEEHPNAIAVLCRVLIELSVDNYLKQTTLATAVENDPLVKKIVAVAEDLRSREKVDKRYLEVVRKARTMDAIISVDTLNKYVHSSNLAPTSEHLAALWDTFAELVVHCLNE
ncbi:MULTISPECIES: hypothetical protein [Hyphomicrobiales]|jgi:hypothetical protein|uniref:hypothetical protein n=1 Tax=Hyphomicrobiales TaxID=356 RepID=UPI000647FA6A|nr:hypothetical protein [Rhizobium sp. WW_1]RKD74053.1 hypothetical protein BJ928_101402 [Rhizobium sp. WW_1]